MTGAWGRQPKESEPAFAAFAAYRDQAAGERSLRILAQESTRSLPLLKRWSKRWEWQRRVAAWDAEQDRVRQEAHLDEVTKLARRHAQAGALALAKGIQGLMAAETLSPSEAVRAVEVGARLELRARGLLEPDAMPDVDGPTALLDLLERRLWPMAMAGDLAAVDRILQIQERRARATGSDAPGRVQVGGVSGLIQSLLGGKSPVELSPELRQELSNAIVIPDDGWDDDQPDAVPSEVSRDIAERLAPGPQASPEKNGNLLH